MDEIAGATFNEVVTAAQDQYDNVITAIARNPLQAVGIAAGIGFVAARLLRPKRPAPVDPRSDYRR
jgi:ElaB/YqjD/DUF883 family membrane-anchored ribosome-binding protein